MTSGTVAPAAGRGAVSRVLARTWPAAEIDQLDLIDRGQLVRIDGGSGRGSKAVYALSGTARAASICARRPSVSVRLPAPSTPSITMSTRRA